jgi:hypothetical protein
LGDIQPDHWLPQDTTELINVLNVLSLLVEREPSQASCWTCFEDREKSGEEKGTAEDTATFD